MSALHRAALVRAYRTLAQGLGGSAVSTALVAVIASLAGGETGRTALIAAGASLGAVVVAAFGSFWQGVALGLPETAEPTLADGRTLTEANADIAAEPDGGIVAEPYTQPHRA